MLNDYMKFKRLSFINFIIRPFLHIGIRHATSFQSSKRIILTNALAILYILLPLPDTLFFIWYKFDYFIVLIPLTFAVFATAIYLNSIGKQQLSGFFLIVNLSLSVFFYGLVFGRDAGFQYVFFPLMATPSVVFGKENKWFLIASMALIGCLFVGMEFFQYPFFFHKELTITQSWLMRMGLIIDSLLIICVIVYFHLQISNHIDLVLHHFLSINQLTFRESEIAVEVAQGKPNKVIATQLFIEESTVKAHLKNIYRKLNIKSRNELISLMMN